MAHKHIVSIDAFSVARVTALIAGVVGFIRSLVTSVFILLGYITIDASVTYLQLGLTVVLAPLFFAAIGFLSGSVFSWLYNMLAKKTGGIRVELK